MRIHFNNLGQAELYLKICKQELVAGLKRSQDVRLPTQKVNNALCQGFGYSSYSELKRILAAPSKEPIPLSSEEDLIAAFTKGFSLTFEMLAEYGHGRFTVEHLTSSTLARSAVEALNGSGPTVQDETEGGELLDRGWALLEGVEGTIPADRAAAAEDIFRAAIVADPELADAYNGLAWIAFERGEFEVSRRHAEVALVKARANLGTDEPSAFSWYGEIGTRPYMRARHNLGLSLMNLGDWKGALREFKELLKRNPNDNQGVRYLIGQLYHLAGDLAHAIPAYRKAAGNNKFKGEPHNEFNYALALYETGEYDEAILRLRYASFLNLHVTEVLLGLPVTPLDIWYGSNYAEPAYALEYIKKYGALWKAKPKAMEFLSAFYSNLIVRSEIDEYVSLRRKLDKTEIGAARGPVIHDMDRLQAFSRLREKNQAITAVVTKGKSGQMASGRSPTRDGIESKGAAPTPYLEGIAQLLRQPASKTVKLRNFHTLLGVRLKRGQSGSGLRVEAWLERNLRRGEIDHAMDVLVLETGDVLFMVQPYLHPNAEEVARVEERGGYILHPHRSWGLLHDSCDPDVYLVPASAVVNFIQQQ